MLVVRPERSASSKRPSPTRRSVSATRWICWRFWWLPILLSTSCQTPPPPQSLPPEAVCQQWNREELTGFYALVQIAKWEAEKGDEFGIASAVAKAGKMLSRCGILEVRSE